MTNEQKQTILEDALHRAYEELEAATRAEMDTPQIKTLLENIREMEWIADRFRPMSVPRENAVPETEAYCEEEDDAPVNKNLPKVKTERFDNVMVSEVVEPAPETPSMSKEELRDKLSTYSNKYGFLDVAQTMNDMGYSKLSEVPQSEYAELLERIENCIKVGV